MALPALNGYAPKELLCLFGSILDELQSRGIVITSNNPVSGHTEWLVSSRLKLKLAGNSEKSFDATDDKGVRYEIKARPVTPNNKSRQLSAIRDIEGGHFDFPIAVVYSKDFDVILALKIPRSVVVSKYSYVKATNSYKLMAEDSLNHDRVCEDVATVGRMLRGI